METTERLTRFALLCGQCNCGCPELFVDHDAPPERESSSPTTSASACR